MIFSPRNRSMLAGLLWCSAAIPASAEGPPALLKGLGDGTIAVISDGDFIAQTYATGQLAPREAGYRDLLTVLSLKNGTIETAAIEVSNSVTAAPEILALTPDGRTAFIVERLGIRPPNGETVRDLPTGRRLFAVDLSDKRAPKVVATVEVGAFPEALSVSPDGRRVAVVANSAEASLLQIVSFADGAFGPVASFPLADLGITGNATAPRGGVTVTNVDWHPSGRFVAVNINTQNRVAFFSIVTRADQGTTVGRWGNPVTVGTDPFVGRFTPDGRHYLTADWGRNFAATNLDGRLPEKPSSISVIRLADPETASDTSEHKRIGGAESGPSSEGLAVSPDGRLVATVNMRGTALPPDSPRFDREGTVSLLSFDPETGTLAKLTDIAFEGVLPEGGVFDRTGDHFLATVFQSHAGGPAGGGIEVFRVEKGERPGLKHLGRIPVPHGAHHVDAGP